MLFKVIQGHRDR